MENRTRFLPWWVWAIVVMEAAVPAFFALATWADPGAYIVGAESVSYPIGLYITRNLTAALGIVLAVLLRSHAAIFVMICVRMATDIADMYNASVNGGGDDVVALIPVLAVVLLVLPSFAQWHLFKQLRSG